MIVNKSLLLVYNNNNEMKSSQLLKILKEDGWYVVRQKGSHKIMAHPTKPGTFPFPDHGSAEIGKGLENAILKQAGLK